MEKLVGTLFVWCFMLISIFSLTGCYGEDRPKLNVHLVPHTHDDVGWLKTVDEYYYGDMNFIQHAGVQYILDSVIDNLQKNPDRKFIYVEIAFFTRWWNEQTEATKAIVRKLVQDGQLEFINGGWCMNDEASTHYNAIIDQMSLGLRFISNNFGVRPTVGWHIDPFGHSSVQASLFSLMGFDSFYFGRLDYGDKALRLNKSEMELMWQGSKSLGVYSDLFTGVLYQHYTPPTGFCFDDKCSDEPIMDDKDLEGYNVDERVDTFITYALNQAKHYKTNNIMMTMGSDFQYENADLWFKNLDKLIKYVQLNGTVNVMYSTPSIYAKYVNEGGIKLTLKTDDFFPYADAPWNYWSGYFTSRPSLKGYVRKTNSDLQACKQLEAITPQFNMGSGPSSITLQNAMGVAQHHDAVSGTEKQHVADDYAKRLYIGGEECQVVMATYLSKLATKPGSSKMDLKFCESLNISMCTPSESGEFTVMIYNPLGRSWSGMVRLPLIDESVSISGPDGSAVQSQVVPISQTTLNVRKPSLVNNISAELEVVFPVTDIPPLGYKMYTSTRTKPDSVTSKSIVKNHGSDDGDVTIKNDYYSVTFDSVSGRIKTITNAKSSISCKVDQQFKWYNASIGNKISKQASGAYIMRTNSSTPFDVNDEFNNAKMAVIDGDLVSEVRQTFAPWVYQSVRLYKDLPAIELEFTVGPVPISDNWGKEVISRFTTDLKSEDIWWTDANGRDMQLRKRNYRPTWKYNMSSPVAGNYYPVNSRIFIRDVDKGIQFTVLNDRSQGGSSMINGSIELMVHRRLLVDDNRGVREPLNETGVTGKGLIVRGRHWIILDNVANSTYWQRMLAEKIMLQPQLAFSTTKVMSNINSNYNLMYTGMSTQLPDNVHLLTLERLDESTVLLRLDHQFEDSDLVPYLNAAVSVKLNGLFNAFKIKEVTELGLGGNVLLSEIKKMQWTLEDGAEVPGQLHLICPPVSAPDFEVKLVPMMIRTFNLTVEFAQPSSKWNNSL